MSSIKDTNNMTKKQKKKKRRRKLTKNYDDGDNEDLGRNNEEQC